MTDHVESNPSRVARSPKHRPVRFWIHYDGAPESGEDRPNSVTCVLARPAVRRLEQQRLDTRVVVVDLAHAPEEVDVRSDDVVRWR